MNIQQFLLSPKQQQVSTYLQQRAGNAPNTTRLEHDDNVDVVIVGAGYTGLSAALSLLEAGQSVAVLEAHHIGWGGSGRAWGQVAAFAKFMPAKVEQDYGVEIGRRINQAAAHGPDLVFDLIEKYQMSCDQVRTGNLIAAHNPEKEQWLKSLVQDLKKRNYPVQLLEQEETQCFIGSERYRYALFDPRGGALNPLAYAQGLAKAVLNQGGRIYTDTPVTSLQRQGEYWQVITADSKIQASAVILATNAFSSNELFEGLGREIMPVRAYQLISEPLSMEQLAVVLPQKQPLNDTRKLFSGVRIWPDGRMQIGVDGPPFKIDGQAMLRSAQKRISMMFPQLSGLKWEYQWGGWVDMSDNEYPRIHHLADNLWTALGFSGRGIAIGTIMGQDLAKLVLNPNSSEAIHPITPLKPLAYHRWHRPLINLLTQSYRVQDWFHDRAYQ